MKDVQELVLLKRSCESVDNLDLLNVKFLNYT